MQVGNSFNTQTSNYVNDNKTGVEKALARIAATKELNGTDGASLILSNALSSQISSMTQSIQNSNDAIGMYQIADGALKALSIGSDTLGELSVRYNSDTLNASQKGSLEQAFTSVTKGMKDIMAQATFNGQNVLSSTLGLDASQLDSLSISNQQSVSDLQNNLTSLSSEVSSRTKSYEVGIANALSSVSNLTSANAQISETPLDKIISDLSQNQIKLDSSMMAQLHQTTLMQQQISTLLA